MFKRVLLGLALLASISWIGYIGFGIFTATNDYSEVHVFNKDDGRIVIVNRANEVNFSALEGFETSPNYEVVQQLTPSYTTGFFSLNRAHFILVNSTNWDENALKETFNQEDFVVNPKKKTFSFGNWSGSYKMDRLYISQTSFEPTKQVLDDLVYDKKASASILNFRNDNTISSVLDVYFKENGKVDYITRDKNIEQGNQVRDEALFGAYVSRKVKSYHFYERDYYATLDKEFAKSPMVKWLQSGFVETEYAGETVLISDYIDGQDPILILNDIQQTLDASTFKTPLTSTFPKTGKSYVVKYLDDLVVIAQKEEICDQFIADYKLGNTISQHGDTRKRIFGDLPQSVSERYITNDIRLSKAVYHGYLLETRFGKSEVQAVGQDQSVAMPCNFNIVDFHVFNETGKVVALGSKGELNFFSKGKLAWKKALDSKAFGEIQVIELHGGGEQHVLLNTEDAIYLWDLKGNEASGFPIKLEGSAVNEVKFYRWKEKSYFLIANEKSEVIQFDSEGRELTLFKSKVTPNRKVDVWASQGRLFFGFASSSQFEMFETERNKSLRTFNIPSNSESIKTPNQLYQFGFEEGKLCQYDQKGSKTTFESYANGKLLPITDETKNPTLIVQSRNTLHFINQKGIEFGKLRMPFNEIEDVSYFNLNSGKTVVSVIDGLENNVYLYNMAGTKLIDRTLEGKTKVSVYSNGKGITITTVVDNYVIQYYEN